MHIAAIYAELLQPYTGLTSANMCMMINCTERDAQTIANSAALSYAKNAIAATVKQRATWFGLEDLDLPGHQALCMLQHANFSTCMCVHIKYSVQVPFTAV